MTPRTLTGVRLGYLGIFAGILGTVVLLMGACVWLSGCGAALEQAEVAAYGGNQITCTAAASSRAADDACRDAVKVYWCGDGGALATADACSAVLLSDGKVDWGVRDLPVGDPS